MCTGPRRGQACCCCSVVVGFGFPVGASKVWCRHGRTRAAIDYKARQKGSGVNSLTREYVGRMIAELKGYDRVEELSSSRKQDVAKEESGSAHPYVKIKAQREQRDF